MAAGKCFDMEEEFTGLDFHSIRLEDRFIQTMGTLCDEIRKKRRQGRVEATIPRDSRSNVPEREAALQVRYAPYAIKRPQLLNKIKTLPDSIAMQVIYVREEKTVKGKLPIEWLRKPRFRSNQRAGE
jgi:hypothetical protein